MIPPGAGSAPGSTGSRGIAFWISSARVGAGWASKALQRLPERQRSALLLSYYEGLSQKEVAQVLGLGLRAVESLIVRARRALGKTLEEQHARTP